MGRYQHVELATPCSVLYHLYSSDKLTQKNCGILLLFIYFIIAKDILLHQNNVLKRTNAVRHDINAWIWNMCFGDAERCQITQTESQLEESQNRQLQRTIQ